VRGAGRPAPASARWHGRARGGARRAAARRSSGGVRRARRRRLVLGGRALGGAARGRRASSSKGPHGHEHEHERSGPARGGDGAWRRCDVVHGGWCARSAGIGARGLGRASGAGDGRAAKRRHEKQPARAATNDVRRYHPRFRCRKGDLPSPLARGGARRSPHQGARSASRAATPPPRGAPRTRREPENPEARRDLERAATRPRDQGCPGASNHQLPSRAMTLRG
jgi:hypothetical protein